MKSIDCADEMSKVPFIRPHLSLLMLLVVYALSLQFGRAQSIPEVTLFPVEHPDVNVTLLWMDEDGLLADVKRGDWTGSEIPALDGVTYYGWYQLDSIVVSSSAATSEESTSIWGMVGFFLGMLGGGALGYSVNSENGYTIVLGAVLGAALLGFIGADLSRSSELDGTYYPTRKATHETLRRICCFPDELPGALRKKLPPSETQ